MTRIEYQWARRIVRQDGRQALASLPPRLAHAMAATLVAGRKRDRLAERGMELAKRMVATDKRYSQP